MKPTLETNNHTHNMKLPPSVKEYNLSNGWVNSAVISVGQVNNIG